jgi:hypothetical protein
MIQVKKRLPNGRFSNHECAIQQMQLHITVSKSNDVPAADGCLTRFDTDVEHCPANDATRQATWRLTERYLRQTIGPSMSGKSV